MFEIEILSGYPSKSIIFRFLAGNFNATSAKISVRTSESVIFMILTYFQVLSMKISSGCSTVLVFLIDFGSNFKFHLASIFLYFFVCLFLKYLFCLSVPCLMLCRHTFVLFDRLIELAP